MIKVSGWFKQQIEAGAIKRMTPGLYPAILMGPVQEYVKNHMLCGKVSDVKAVAEELGNAAWAALKTPDTA